MQRASVCYRLRVTLPTLAPLPNLPLCKCSCADKLCASCPRDPAVCRRCLPGYRLVQGECVKVGRQAGW